MKNDFRKQKFMLNSLFIFAAFKILELMISPEKKQHEKQKPFVIGNLIPLIVIKH